MAAPSRIFFPWLSESPFRNEDWIANARYGTLSRQKYILNVKFAKFLMHFFEFLCFQLTSLLLFSPHCGFFFFLHSTSVLSSSHYYASVTHPIFLHTGAHSTEYIMSMDPMNTQMSPSSALSLISEPILYTSSLSLSIYDNSSAQWVVSEGSK